MKKKGKYYADRRRVVVPLVLVHHTLKSIGHRPMGPAPSGRVLKSYFISEHYALLLVEMAARAGVPVSRYLEALVESAACHPVQ